MIDFAFLINDKLINIKDFYSSVCLNIEQGPPQIEFNNLNFNTVDGERETNNNNFKPFEIKVRFLIKSRGVYNRRLIQAEFNDLIFQRQSYFILNEVMPGKRIAVQPVDIENEYVAVDGTVYQVTFKAFKACAESIENTTNEQDIAIQDWQFSQGLIPLDYQYSYRKNHFSIYNIGDFAIDPRKKHELKIKLTGRSDGKVTIYNQTTGERFIFNDSLSKEKKDVLEIEGIHCYKNGVIRNIDTNGVLITLAKGENKFIIENVSQVTISFETRFLYKG